ncbi:sigma-70 family RNA polymerase sigma factor [Pyxidicoccus fallax]|uniref:Sigma-70 family RNA polymerase sigma factor n=1 Tax=Pyxidicoccus fallax TaxID=394095 RepID=A0A848LKF8_9BACT|nr:sigma-70 family RNA polymerase sigma factor [Pyxidicoccus fallax]NMO18211.1 sigma-70 family RNA polymerase sigma factor [Pyxidicoccus fallax]NPC84815.1 sigma-70 family RNA polymerase sigma factor [Pyxidicoccus fallax]
MSLLRDDVGLLEAFRRGEPAALARVYQAYSAHVARFLSRTYVARGPAGFARVGPLDLEAAHQETFVRAFREQARRDYDGVRPFEAWLNALARQAAVDVLRAAGRIAREAVPLENTPIVERLATDSPSPEDRALEAETRELVRRFLDGLDEAGRSFADLRFVQGLSQERAGAALGLSRQEARTREAKLRRALMDHLSAEGWLTSEPGTVPSAAVTAAVLVLLFPHFVP